MPSSETLVKDLCSRLTSQVPTGQVDWDNSSLLGLGRQIAAIQGKAMPMAQLKGMACLAADASTPGSGTQELRDFLADGSPLLKLSSHCDVKWLVADVGLSDDLSNSPFSAHLLPRLLRRISSKPDEAVWDSVQEGVRLACRMKGRGTDLFGLCFLTTLSSEPKDVEEVGAKRAWPIACAAGFLLAAADLQTPVIISGAASISALRVACSLVPSVSNSVLLAQPTAVPHYLGRLRTLLPWTAPDPVAVIMGLDLCQSAAKFLESQDRHDGKAV